jgi:hypothetical protein
MLLVLTGLLIDSPSPIMSIISLAQLMSVTLKLEAEGFSKTQVTVHQTTQYHTPEDTIIS